MAKMVNIRCRKCWKDVHVQLENETPKDCPLCKKKETYQHSYTVFEKKKRGRA